ncbi:hypothetical protein M422DRAFT_30094 [Sphaerobolus stellatus SS14]|uniref:Iron-sulfur assembly protein 1 n=1 Tax=Sphaerobolus stellatus (strain SS14) TaxID=990650 RepID=A0A0C9UQL9_SPHS4|nr:hypothetical protein M422DRAFT_30094 [Sphaerobolus stellatus SS14]
MNVFAASMLRASSSSLTQFACCRGTIPSLSAARYVSRYSTATHAPPLSNSPPVVIPEASRNPSTPQTSTQSASFQQPKSVTKPRSRLRATKAAMSLTPTAVSRLRNLLSGPTPQYIRVGVKNKGCAGMSYNLEYVDKPEKFDEIVEQDGVKVLIDSKALFSIIGSEMDWHEDRLSSKFVFKNPNIKDACGCGESFNI